MNVVFSSGYQGVLCDDLAKDLYYSEHLPLRPLILLERRMESFNIIAFENEPNQYVAIDKVKEQINAKYNITR